MSNSASRSLTKQSQKMLPTVDIAHRFAREALPISWFLWAFDPLMDVEILVALEAVQQDAAQCLVEILLNALNNLLQNVCIGAARNALCPFLLFVPLEDGCYCILAWKGDEVEVLSNLLPVVNEQRLELVGHWDADSWSGAECFLLFIIS